MGKKVFTIDLDACTGCYLCQIACKDEHVGNSHSPFTKPQPETGHFWMKVTATERGRTPQVKSSYFPLMCMHCDNAPCIKACPEDAIIRRDDGLVWIDPAKCNGCGLCVEACPYDVIYFNESLQIAQKCTGCAHLVDKGMTPRCVDICPHDAIIFGDDKDPGLKRYLKKAEVYHPEYDARPLVQYIGLPKPFIRGTLLDRERDEVVKEAKVIVTNLHDDKRCKRVSDEFGDFSVDGLEKDRRYMIEIEKVGYKKHRAVVKLDKDLSLGVIILSRE